MSRGAGLAGIEHDIMESFDPGEIIVASFHYDGYGPDCRSFHIPEFLLLTTECQWYRQNRMTGKGVPELEKAAAANDDFTVDYVRVYDVVK